MSSSPQGCRLLAIHVKWVVACLEDSGNPLEVVRIPDGKIVNSRDTQCWDSFFEFQSESQQVSVCLKVV